MLFVTVAWYSLHFYFESLEGNSKEKMTSYVLFLREYQSNLRTLLSFMLVYFYQQIYSRAKVTEGPATV